MVRRTQASTHSARHIWTAAPPNAMSIMSVPTTVAVADMRKRWTCGVGPTARRTSPPSGPFPALVLRILDYPRLGEVRHRGGRPIVEAGRPPRGTARTCASVPRRCVMFCLFSPARNPRRSACLERPLGRPSLFAGKGWVKEGSCPSSAWTAGRQHYWHRSLEHPSAGPYARAHQL